MNEEHSYERVIRNGITKQREPAVLSQDDTVFLRCLSEVILGYMTKILSANGGCLGSRRR